MRTINIAVLVSGGGTNLQALIDAVAGRRLAGGRIALVLSSREGAYALERAHRAGIRTAVVSKEDHPGEDVNAKAILAELAEAQADLVVTAGYMSILPKSVCSAYKGRMINIHPSLLPKYGGIGFYGLRVHKAVLEAGEKESGATVHYVDDEGVDSGEIILQKRTAILDGDTPEILQKRILEEVEHDLIVAGTQIAIDRLAAGAIMRR